MEPGLERSGSPGFIECDPLPCGFAPAFLHGPSEAIAVRAGLDDVGSVGDAVEQRFAEPGVRNHLSPFRKGQIGGQDDGCLLRPFGDDLEEELCPEVCHGNIADLIDGDQVLSIPSCQYAAQL